MPEEISSLCYLLVISVSLELLCSSDLLPNRNNGLYFEPPREQFYMRINNRDNNASIVRMLIYEILTSIVDIIFNLGTGE